MWFIAYRDKKVGVLSLCVFVKRRGAELLTGGEQNHLEGDLAGGYYSLLFLKE
jgi:aldehyde dehydrogenase